MEPVMLVQESWDMGMLVGVVEKVVGYIPKQVTSSQIFGKDSRNYREKNCGFEHDLYVYRHVAIYLLE